MSGTYNQIGVVLFPELQSIRRGLGFKDKDIEFSFRYVEFDVTGSHLKGGFLVGNWIYESVA